MNLSLFYRFSTVFVVLVLLMGCSKNNEFNNQNQEVLYSLENRSINNKLKLNLVDSLFLDTKKGLLDSITLKILSLKSNLHYKLKQKDSSFIYDKLLFKSSNTINDYYYSGKAALNLALYFDKMEVTDSTFYYFNLSKGYFLNIKDSSQVGKRLMSMGIIQKNQNDFFGSKETITEALQFLNPKKDMKYISSCYNILGTNHRKLLNFPDALNYYTKAIEIATSKKDKLISQNNIAASYTDDKQYYEAILLFQNISSDTTLRKNKKEYQRVLDNLAYAKWLSGEIITEKEFQEPLKFRKQNKDQRGQIASYTHLGEYHSKTRPKRAKSYFDSVIQLSKKLKIPRAEKDALKFLMQLQPQNIKIRDRYVYLQDSLYIQETKVKTQFAKYKYDDKVTQEANSRLEKENAEQELKVSQQRNQKTLTYAIGLPVLLLLGFLTYIFIQRSKRLKRQNKTAKLEATYETEAELSRKLHDDFGGKLNHAMLLLQSDANNEEVLNIVDGLYNQSRDFSREINDVDTGPNFKNFLFGMMGNYCKNKKLITTGSTEVNWLKLSPLSKKTLFKVLQELMINMQKHSNASLVSISFEQSKKTLKIRYLDNGVGASKEELHIKNGLWNTEKRIKAIGGTIIFDSEKENGFEAQIEIPN